MLYSFFCYDHPNSLQSRIKARPAHIERLHALQAENRLIIAGPNPAIDDETPGDAGFTGSLIIAKFNSLQEAQAWADAEPYLKAGVYSHVEVKPFKKVLPS
ncbi:YciI family protein [Piscirickettsia salmonis]|uniref:YciI family protein n=1 Tax=Piscirickettsia salmonis TaxID=1238 RepID=UPI0007C92507|nr:YciI-like protein [Piscirickettsiaceae bacterium NZ-RLO1]